MPSPLSVVLVDHDRLFKELLTTFFAEFLALFLPQVHEYVAADSFEFLDKEVFTDVTAGDKSVYKKVHSAMRLSIRPIMAI